MSIYYRKQTALLYKTFLLLSTFKKNHINKIAILILNLSVCILMLKTILTVAQTSMKC